MLGRFPAQACMGELATGCNDEGAADIPLQLYQGHGRGEGH